MASHKPVKPMPPGHFSALCFIIERPNTFIKTYFFILPQLDHILLHCKLGGHELKKKFFLVLEA